MGVNGIDSLGLGALSWLFGNGYSGEEADAFDLELGKHLLNIESGITQTVTNPGAVINKGIENTATVMARNIQDSNSIIDNVQAIGTGLGYLVSSATGTKDILESSYGIDILEERELSGMERTSKALMGVSSLILTGVGQKAAYNPTATFKGSLVAAKNLPANTLRNVKNFANKLKKIKAPKRGLNQSIRTDYKASFGKWKHYAETMKARGTSIEHIAKRVSNARLAARSRFQLQTPLF
jgi:hypothetical protein